MSIAQIVLIAAVVLLVGYIGGGEVYKRKRLRERHRALIKATIMLARLRCIDPADSSLKSKVRAGTMVVLLAIICEDAGIKLEELGTSQEKLDQICERPPEGILDK